MYFSKADTMVPQAEKLLKKFCTTISKSCSGLEKIYQGWAQESLIFITRIGPDDDHRSRAIRAPDGGIPGDRTANWTGPRGGTSIAGHRYWLNGKAGPRATVVVGWSCCMLFVACKGAIQAF